MAQSVDPKTMDEKQSSDIRKQDIYTLNGYTKIFETCESDSDVFARVEIVFSDIDVGVWKAELKAKKMSFRVEHLFSYGIECCDSDKLKDKNYLIKFIQIFSLLGNVFRNTLLRPYIPAYRTINMNCGRYRCFVNSIEEQLFNDLGFQAHPENLLTYQEQDSSRTILYAITCSVFWHVLSMKLKKKYPTTQ